MILKFVLIFLLLCSTNVSGSTAHENQLYTDLLTNYNRELLPRCNTSDNVTVTLDIALREVVSLNEKEQTLTVKIWVRQVWNDCGLQWSPSNYSDISTLSLSNNKIWIPDITLYESAVAGQDMPGRSSYRVFVNSDGLVNSNFPTLVKVTCSVDVTYFPYDTQKCTFKLGSWTYHGLQVDVKQKNNKGDLTSFQTSNEWNIESLTTQRHVVYYGCCPEPYPDVTFTLTIKRKPKFYVLTILFPCILVLGLAALGFILPADSGEKVSLEVTVLLSLSVFLLIVSDKLPASAETFPHIGVYFSVSMMIVCLSCLLTVWVLSLHFRGGSTASVPSWARRVFLRKQRSISGHTSEDRTQGKRKPEDKNRDLDECVNGFVKTTNTNEAFVCFQNGKNTEDAFERAIKNVSNKQSNQLDTEKLTEEEKMDEWRDLAAVMDRIFFIAYLVISVFVTIVFIGVLVGQS